MSKVTWLAVMSFCCFSCKTTAPTDASLLRSDDNGGFVTVQNGKFMLDGKPFYFMGSNFYRLALSDAFNGAVQKVQQKGRNNYPQIDEVMQNYAAENIRVVRLWGFSCENSRGTSLNPPIIYRNMSYSNDALEQLDYTIAAAGRHGVKVILTMVNYEPEYCGWEWWVENSFAAANANDQSRMLYSCFNNDPKNQVVYRVVRTQNECTANGWIPRPTRELFLTDPLVKNNYKKHLASMLNRVNPYTSKAYKEDPAIMAIEVSNEPHTSDYYECLVSNIGNKSNDQCRSEDLKPYNIGQLVNNWLTEITAYVKSIDNHHLVSTGEEGYRFGHEDASCLSPSEWIHNGLKGVDFAKDAAIKSVDFMTTHLYPDNWQIPPENLGFFNRCVIQDRARLAGNNNKPIILEETGFDANIVSWKPQEYASNRAGYLAKMMGMATDAQFQGVLVWQAAPLTVGEVPAEADAFTFPIKTKNDKGYEYTNEGLMVKMQADCMMDYSAKNSIRGDCIPNKP